MSAFESLENPTTISKSILFVYTNVFDKEPSNLVNIELPARNAVSDTCKCPLVDKERNGNTVK